MDEGHKRHNDLVGEFVSKLLGKTKDDAEVMVILESIILGTMLGLYKLYDVKPHLAAEYAESAVNAAVSRFTEVVKK